MKTVTLTIEQLAIITNGLDALKNGWKTTKEFSESEKLTMTAKIAAVETSLKNQTGF